MRSFQHLVLLLANSFLVFAPRTALSNGEQGGSERGKIVSIQELANLSVSELDQKFMQYGLKAKNGVKLYKIAFNTVKPDYEGGEITVSALVVRPSITSANLPWIIQQHFTIIGQQEAPTAQPYEGLFEASQGFFTIVPDNIGYGVSNRFYPTYLFAKAYAENGIDALRAARNFASTVDVKLGPLFLKGYSEGGYATLALQQSLETEHVGEFPLMGSAPTAGPYDTKSFGFAFAATKINSVFLNHLIFSYEQWLSPKLELDNMYEMNLGTLRELYDGSHVSTDIRQKLPVLTRELFNPKFVDDMQLQTPVSLSAQSLQKNLRENTLPQGIWSPATPTRFFHCIDDDVVPAGMTEATVARVLVNNPSAPVSKLMLASPDPAHPYTHVTCPLYFEALSYFVELMSSQH